MPKIGKLYAGIDPGASGGIAVIQGDGSLVECVKMPPTEKDIFECLANCKADFAYLEKVHSMPGQGVSSTFKFGVSYGGLRMALIASSIKFEEVTPRTWQKFLGVSAKGKHESKTQFKNRLKAKAQQLFPELKITLAICDALLLAEYCRRLRCQQHQNKG